MLFTGQGRFEENDALSEGNLKGFWLWQDGGQEREEEGGIERENLLKKGREREREGREEKEGREKEKALSLSSNPKIAYPLITI